MEISDEDLLVYDHSLRNAMQKFKRATDGIMLATLTELYVKFGEMIRKNDKGGADDKLNR